MAAAPVISVAADSAAEDPIWTDLVEWLARFPGGTGVEEKLVEVSSRGVNSDALLNLRTLRPLYPASFAVLNAAQWISLHVALQFRRHLEGDAAAAAAARPPLARNVSQNARTKASDGDETTAADDASVKRTKTKTKTKTATKQRAATSQDKFWPFLASLPRAFPTMPLTWSLSSKSAATLQADFAIPVSDASLAALRAKEEAGGGQKGMQQRRRRRYEQLFERMPAAARRKADEVEKRFAADWHAVRKLWADEGKTVDGDLTFFDFVLGWQNVNTRCIYFDIDGKRENNLTLCPVIDMINHSPGRTTKPDPRLSSLTFCAPAANSSDPALRDGDELSFQYGSHEDAFLLAEYGFVVGEENLYNAVEVDRFVEALFEAQGDEGELKRGVLKDEGYWGDMTLQATPPPSPSWRVLVSLRLLHHRLAAGSTASLSASALAPWYHVVSGAAETISPSNETKQWEKEFKEGSGDEEEEDDLKSSDLLASLRMVRTVWTEEERIARAVLAGPPQATS
ncbi:hypothetical protein RHOSPDRAFT_32052 [Rhodotorula sp. JG-1b]|nr:hypothetical protein RHOSPDRAFT_32052 [Rhodotorula sp. JG-1b]